MARLGAEKIFTTEITEYTEKRLSYFQRLEISVSSVVNDSSPQIANTFPVSRRNPTPRPVTH